MIEEPLERTARSVCLAAVSSLQAAEVPTEGLAELVPERRVLLVRRPPTMRQLTRVWRLGALLLDLDGNLYAAGRATRAAERGRPGYQSVSREERREIAAAALRGGYEVGEAVNFDADPLPLDPEAVAQLPDGSPIGAVSGEIRVRWRANAPLESAPTLAAYLAERISLLIEPPFTD